MAASSSSKHIYINIPIFMSVLLSYTWGSNGAVPADDRDPVIITKKII